MLPRPAHRRRDGARLGRSHGRVRSVRVKLEAYGKYGSIGFELIASMAAGYFIGKWLDPTFGG